MVADRIKRSVLVESGFVALELSEAEKIRYVDEHSQGWDTHMSNLQRAITQ